MSQKLKLGELFAGYGGLGMAVEEVFGADLAWVSEWEPAPSKILAHHWPTVPNYGDITKIDWAGIEPVDILSGGFPCQDLSLAGKQRGMGKGTRSGLWANMLEGIEIIRPRYVVAENVRGLLSGAAHSDVEQCAWCLGDERDEPHLRALGAVLGDVADLGYDAQWRGIRAADVGAPHNRFRVFLLASLPDAGGVGLEARRLSGGSTQEVAELADNLGVLSHADSLGLQRSRQARDRGAGSTDLSEPTPDTESIGRPEWWPESTRLEGRSDALVGSNQDWGDYTAAVRRWERINGPAPRPTERTGRNNGERLSPAFVEWMMGLPSGHVTNPSIGITRNDQLKALGNGVVPAQAKAALRDMLVAFDKQRAT